MIVPDAEVIRSWSKVDFGALGYEDDESLQVLVDRSVEVIEATTGQTFLEMPEGFDKLAEQATQLFTEQMAYAAQPDVAETLSDFGLISSFTAGSYSESRRALSEFSIKTGLLNPNPTLHALLLAMLTDDKRDEWLALVTGVNAPAFAVTEVDWNFGGGRYDAPWGI